MRERRFQRETQSTMSKKLRKKEKTGTALQRCRLDTQSTCIVYTIHAYDMASLRLAAKPFSFSKRLVG